MNPNRFHQLRRAIADVLHQTDGWLYPEPTLFNNINLVMVRPGATLAEFNDVMTKMEIAHHVLRYRGDDGVLKSKLTDEGKAELLS